MTSSLISLKIILLCFFTKHSVSFSQFASIFLTDIFLSLFVSCFISFYLSQLALSVYLIGRVFASEKIIEIIASDKDYICEVHKAVFIPRVLSE